jgi:hypothetical protein
MLSCLHTKSTVIKVTKQRQTFSSVLNINLNFRLINLQLLRMRAKTSLTRLVTMNMYLFRPVCKRWRAEISSPLIYNWNRGTAVGIATRLHNGSSEVRIPRTFFQNAQTAIGAHSASLLMAKRDPFPWVKEAEL